MVATGDSVTATGDWPRMFAMLLGRLTGNTRITVDKAAYPGRSADASVRHWQRDIAPKRPDLLLAMYGLNDQGAWI